MQWFNNLSACGLLLILTPFSVDAEQTLVIASWGGSYEEAQQTALFKPFTEKFKVGIKTLEYSGGLEIFDEKTKPDLVDMSEFDARVACDRGLLEPLSYQHIASSSKNRFQDEQDFDIGTFSPCSIAHSNISTLIAYNPKAFSAKKPELIIDFFDIEQFPGKRGLRKQPYDFFEWALIAEGIPVSQVYDMLSTPRGIKLALKKLDSIREHIVWWEKPEEPAQLLANGSVVMTSGYNGRFFTEQSLNNPINLIWDGQIIDREVWAVPIKKNKNPNIKKFLQFATKSEQQAALARHIPYGPVRHSAMWQIGRNPEQGVRMLDYLPTAPHHLKSALYRNVSWYVHTSMVRRRAFMKWLRASDDHVPNKAQSEEIAPY